MNVGNGRTARLNMRLTPEALLLIREASVAENQDITSFVLDAALNRARAVFGGHHEFHP